MIPQLYVFAGPNGAGKSTFSPQILAEGTPIFDGDKEFAKLKSLFDATDSGTLYDAVNGHIFDDWKNKQLEDKTDCAFETNFRSEQTMESVTLFRQAGYECHLYFFGLDSIEAAIERVKHRVTNGGHAVNLENIQANYSQGLENLTKFFSDFDTVTLLQNFAKTGEAALITPLMSIEKGRVLEIAAKLPDWVKAFKEQAYLQHRKKNGLGL